MITKRFSIGGLTLASLCMLSLQFGGTWGCGSSSTPAATSSDSTGTVSISATVTVPTAALTLATLAAEEGSDEAAQVVWVNKYAEVAPTSGSKCEAQDASGNVIGTAGETNAAGTATISGLTEAQVTAGVVVKCVDATSKATVTDYQKPISADLTTNADGTKTLTDAVNSTSTVTASAINSSCPGFICPSTINPRCIRRAMGPALKDMGAVTAEASTNQGYTSALMRAAQAMIAKGGSVNPMDAFSKAISGNGVGDITTATGSARQSGVDLSTAATNFKAMLDTFKGQCTPDTGTGKTPLDTVEAAAVAKGETFNPGNAFGLMGGFDPSSFQAISPKNFLNFTNNMGSIPNREVYFKDPTMLAGIPNMFKQGGDTCGDATKGPTFFGFFFSSMPPVSGGTTDFSKWNPTTAASAAGTTYQAFVGGGAITFPPLDQIYGTWRDKLGDSSFQSTIYKSGAVGTINDMMGAYARGPTTGFKPGDYSIPVPGTKCTIGSTSTTQCLPGDICNAAGVCQNSDSTMGQACYGNSGSTTDSAKETSGLVLCGSKTMCAGYTGFERCMYAQGIPTGMQMVGTNGGTTTFGAAGAPPPPKTCSSTVLCSGSDKCNAGMCVPSSFGLPGGASCSVASDCLSGSSCTNSICTFVPNLTSKATMCALGADCSSCMCASGFCDWSKASATTPPVCADPTQNTIFSGAVDTSKLGGTGASCNNPSACLSNVCTASTCAAPLAGAPTIGTAGTPPSGGAGTPTTGFAPAGAPCFRPSDCVQGTYCDPSTVPMKCVAPPR